MSWVTLSNQKSPHPYTYLRRIPYSHTDVGNLSACREGLVTCDYSLLSRAEAHALATAERLRNHAACLDRRGYCDRSRLTAAEAAAIPLPAGSAP